MTVSAAPLRGGNGPSQRAGAPSTPRIWGRRDMLSICMDFVSFADFWAPAEGNFGPRAGYVGSLAPEM